MRISFLSLPMATVRACLGCFGRGSALGNSISAGENGQPDGDFYVADILYWSRARGCACSWIYSTQQVSYTATRRGHMVVWIWAKRRAASMLEGIPHACSQNNAFEFALMCVGEMVIQFLKGSKAAFTKFAEVCSFSRSLPVNQFAYFGDTFPNLVIY